MQYLFPKDRLIELGPESLTDVELLSVLLRTGATHSVAERLLEKAGGLSAILRLTPRELVDMRGMGRTKAATLLAVREITERVFRRKVGVHPAIHGVQDAYQLFIDLILEDQEVLSAAFLDPRNRVLHRENIFRGSLMYAMTSPREILRLGLRLNAASVLVAHNHPSQDPTPSPDDREFTHQLREACRLVGMHFLDHLIICSGNNYVSLSAEAWKMERESSGEGEGCILPCENAVAED